MIRLFQPNFCAISNCKGSSLVLQIFYSSFIIEKIVTPLHVKSTTTDYRLRPGGDSSILIHPTLPSTIWGFGVFQLLGPRKRKDGNN